MQSCRHSNVHKGARVRIENNVAGRGPRVRIRRTHQLPHATHSLHLFQGSERSHTKSRTVVAVAMVGGGGEVGGKCVYSAQPRTLTTPAFGLPGLEWPSHQLSHIGGGGGDGDGAGGGGGGDGGGGVGALWHPRMPLTPLHPCAHGAPS